MGDKEVTPADDYVFELEDELKKIAENELRETDETRQFALKTLREWIEKNPKILKCRFDSKFLLRFLRCKKYSLPTIYTNLERYLLLRQVYADGAFLDIDATEPNIEDLFNVGFLLPLPNRDKQGRRVVIARPGAFDMQKHTSRDIMRIYSLTSEVLIEDEQNQIRGFVYLVDASGFSIQHLTLFSPKEAVRLVKNGEQFVPMRHKLGIAFNLNPTLKIAVDFGMSLLSEKMKSRVKIFTNLENCSDVDQSILPKEYGGDVPTKEMVDLWKMEIASHQSKRKLNDLMRVNLKMFSDKECEGHVSALRENGDAPDDWAGLQGSFRKLEVD